VSVIQAGIGSFSLDDLPENARVFVLGEPHVYVGVTSARPKPSLTPR
jgi:hypothetical protein